ncbi:hypothetical protein GOP56_10270 [Brevibacillus sp. 7WMA2]|uniref:glycine rich domain-containing protein n=1 Tax=Brevibacillus sp. 7WMA2 TaxID=2683193 RepID=UPI0013A74187|nr:glycine rich domain-containing protein [Brevibacillus sp. 7WMA2]QIC05959.1 hypothetical protein GOP56_10270 [Brevibacillus sp. 7WMA2]
MPTWNYTGAVQTWTVPKTGRYRVVAMGASGGVGTQNSEGVYSLGGKGSEVTGDIYLTAGQELKVVVGEKGKNAKNSYFEWQRNGDRGVDKTTGGHGGIAGVFDAVTGFPLLIARGGNGGYDSCYYTTRNSVHRRHGEDGSIDSLLTKHGRYNKLFYSLTAFDKVPPRFQREHPEDKNLVYSVDPVYGEGIFSRDDTPPTGINGTAFTVNHEGFISSRQGVHQGNATLSIELVEEGKVIAPSTDLRVLAVTTTITRTSDTFHRVRIINPILNRELRKDERVGIKVKVVYKKSDGTESISDSDSYQFITSNNFDASLSVSTPSGYTLNHQNTDVEIQLLVFNPAGVTEIPMQTVLANPPEKPVFKAVPTVVKVGPSLKVEWAPVSAPAQSVGKPNPTKIYYSLDFSKDGTNFTEVTKDHSITFCNHIMREEFISTKAVYRVRAYVKATGEYTGIASDYSLSNPFTIEKNAPPDYPINVSPAGTLESPAIITTQTPTITWKYTDPNKEDTQSAYRVLIKKALDDSVVHDTEKVNSSQSTFTLPPGIIEKNTFYYHQIHVFDSSGLENENIQRQYFVMNPPPSGLIIIGPEDTRRTGTKPSFEAVIGNDLEKDNQHFMIQLAEDADFTKNVQTFRSNKDIQGWEAKLLNEDYQAITEEGVTSSYEGGSVRYTIQSDLQEGLAYFWRMAPVDATTGAQGIWSTARSIKVGNVLQFQLKKPITTSLAAERMVFRAKVKLPTDGKLPASLKMEACNNALDEEPAWENITEAYTQGKYHAFKNKTKSADGWALDVRITINANDSLGEIECDGFGLSFD